MLINVIGFPYFTDKYNTEDDLKIISSDCFTVQYTNESKTTGIVYPEVCYVFKKIDAYKLVEHWNNMSSVYHYKIVSIAKG